MSDLSDLVHQATIDTIERVRREERERIIKLLEDEVERFNHEDFYAVGVTNKLIELIKGETNDN